MTSRWYCRLALHSPTSATTVTTIEEGLPFLSVFTTNHALRYLEANGTEPLLAVMAIHLQTSVKVQRQACWALLTLAGSDEIARVIVGQGGSDHLMKAMVQWKCVLLLFLLASPTPRRYDAGLQQFACWAICNLALADEEIKQKIRHSGILEVTPACP